MGQRTDAPSRGTREYDAWVRGAQAEARERTKGMSKEGKEIYDCVQTLAQQGHSQFAIIRWLVFVYASGWKRHAKIKLIQALFGRL